MACAASDACGKAGTRQEMLHAKGTKFVSSKECHGNPCNDEPLMRGHAGSPADRYSALIAIVLCSAMPTSLTELLIADDHPLFREALIRSVHRLMPEALVHEADSVDSLMALVQRHPAAELLLLDLNMPGAHGFSALAQLRRVRPQLPVAIVSAREDGATIRRALAHGAAGFIPKSANLATLNQALAALLAGDEWTPEGDFDPAQADAGEVALANRLAELTPQQFRVLSMICRGLLNKQIAFELGVAHATVKVHVRAILGKLSVHTRTQAVMLVHRLSSDPDAVLPLAVAEADEDE